MRDGSIAVSLTMQKNISKSSEYYTQDMRFASHDRRTRGASNVSRPSVRGATNAAKWLLALLGTLLALMVSFALLPIYMNDGNGFASSISRFMTIAIISYSLILIISYKLQRSFDAFQVFVAFSFPFLFGQQLLVSIGNSEGLHITNLIITNKCILDASIFALQSVICLFIGYLIYGLACMAKGPRRYTKIGSAFMSVSSEDLRRACGILAIASAPLALYSMTKLAGVSRSQSYADLLAYKGSQSTSIPILLASGLLPSSLLGLFVTRDQNGEMELYAIIAYCVLYGLQGSRISIFCFLATIVLVRLTEQGPPKPAKLLSMLCIASLAIVLLSAVSVARQNQWMGVVGSMTYGLEKTFEDGFLYHVLRELGSSFMIMAACFMYMPSPIRFTRGLSYVSAVVYLFPNRLVGNFYNTIPNPDNTLSPFLTRMASGFGSSFAAESYFNFAQFGLLVSVVLGVVLGMLSKAVARKDINKVQQFVSYSIFMVIIFYVRSDTRTLLRNVVWYLAPIFVLSYFIHTQRYMNAKN